jgi:hypothetical protein
LSGSTYGPLAHGGFRFLVKEKPITIRLFYKKGLEKVQFNSFGAGLLYGL